MSQTGRHRLMAKSGSSYDLRDGPNLIGRWEGCDIALSSAAAVSAKHVLIIVENGCCVARDLNSRNGTTLNGVPLTADAALTHGDQLVLGAEETLRFEESSKSSLGDGTNETSESTTTGWRWAANRLPALAAAPTERALLEELVSQLVSLTRCDAYAVTWSGELGTASCSYRCLVGDSSRDLPAPTTVSASLLGLCCDSSEPVWLDDVSRARTIRRAESIRALGESAAAVLPLGRHGAVVLTSSEALETGARTAVEALTRMATALLHPEVGRSRTITFREQPGLVAVAPATRDLVEEIQVWAPMPFNVVLLGERGSGKTHFAKALHRESGATGAFVHADCPAHLRGDLAASALFGHEKGAFTGAERRRVGWAEEAANGTLFLDEIGDISPEAQAMLLTLVQERRFRRVGGEEDLPFLGRVVAATNRPIDGAQSTFRRDLYDRLSEVVLVVPSLRSRREDIPDLLSLFVELEGERMRHPGIVVPHEFSREAVAELQRAPWPGNLRDLRNEVRRAMARAIRCGTTRVDVEHLTTAPPDGAGLELNLNRGLEDLKQDFERRVLARALDEAEGNQRAAARLLGISNQAWHRARKRCGL